VPLLTNAHQISAIAYGYLASQALFSALELDLFTRIAGGTDNVAGLSRETGIAENRLRTLVTCLNAAGLTSEADGRLANSPAAANFLVAGAASDFREYIRVVNGRILYPGMLHIGQALRGERVFADKSWYEGMIYERGLGAEFSAAQHAGSLGPAHLLARRLDLSGAGRLLDVGGGSGAFTITLCRANPSLRATILDFPATVETARMYAAEAGLADRISHLAGDARAADWPGDQDLVLMSYVWSAVPGEDLAELSRRAYRALKPGGRVLVHDFMVEDDHSGPSFAALYLLAALFDTPSATCLTPTHVERMLCQAGFANAASEVLLPGITSFTQAAKPL
jgi:2-hydroxy-4-(methylsulfanyl)butanoate S-methyltransferase